MIGTFVSSVLALGALFGAAPASKHDKTCAAGQTIRKVVLVPYVKKPAYSKDPRQHLYRRVVIEVPVAEAKTAACTCGAP
jgi:hypothetical protein